MLDVRHSVDCLNQESAQTTGLFNNRRPVGCYINAFKGKSGRVRTDRETERPKKILPKRLQCFKALKQSGWLVASHSLLIAEVFRSASEQPAYPKIGITTELDILILLPF
jgi:hypothetical protein